MRLKVGPANPATTLNVYAYFVLEADEEAASALAGVSRKAREATSSPAPRELAATQS